METNRAADGFPGAGDDAIGRHWIPFFLEGATLVVLGLVAVVIAYISTVAVTRGLGWLFLISGVVGLIATYWTRRLPGYWWSLVSALLGLVVGALLLSQQTNDLYRGLYVGWPFQVIAPLTLVLVGFFAIEGVVSIMYGLTHRSIDSSRWVWIVASGILDLALAGFVVLGMAGTAAWAVGLLVGANMVFGGISLIAMALHARGKGLGPYGS